MTQCCKHRVGENFVEGSENNLLVTVGRKIKKNTKTIIFFLIFEYLKQQHQINTLLINMKRKLIYKMCKMSSDTSHINIESCLESRLQMLKIS
jgi:hypothetical protein